MSGFIRRICLEYGGVLRNFEYVNMTEMDSRYISELWKCEITGQQIIRMILIFNYFSEKENIGAFNNLNLTEFGKCWQNGIIKRGLQNNELKNNTRLMNLLIFKGHHRVFHFLAGEDEKQIFESEIINAHLESNIVDVKSLRFCSHNSDFGLFGLEEKKTQIESNIKKIIKNVVYPYSVENFVNFYKNLCRSYYPPGNHIYFWDIHYLLAKIFNNSEMEIQRKECFRCFGKNLMFLSTKKILQEELWKSFVILKKILEKESSIDLLRSIFKKFLEKII